MGPAPTDAPLSAPSGHLASNTRYPETPATSSFRDPAGYVALAEGRVFRRIRDDHVHSLARLEKSGLYRDLVSRGMLVKHERLGKETSGDGTVFEVIEHERVPFISHPYEWTFSMLRDAALLTLDVQIEALKHDITLRDASAFNIQFIGSRPIFIDTLSFGDYVTDRPWTPYRQFCQHFLAPLALVARTDHRLGRLHANNIDGIPLDLAARILPWRTRLDLGLAVHIHAHARSLKSASRKPSESLEDRAAKARLSRSRLSTLLTSLRDTVAALNWNEGNSVWSDYYKRLDHYGATGLETKERIIAGILEDSPRGMLWDVGANTGQFSRIASRTHSPVVAWDFDPLCVETLYRSQHENAGHILPLVLDLANPSPSLGWAQQERAGLVERGPADVVMALGLLHHLVFTLQVPLPRVADFFSKIARRLVIEFVPREDSQASLLASRVSGGGHTYDLPTFEHAFGARFRIASRHPIAGTLRTIYVMDAP